MCGMMHRPPGHHRRMICAGTGGRRKYIAHRGRSACDSGTQTFLDIRRIKSKKKKHIIIVLLNGSARPVQYHDHTENRHEMRAIPRIV